VIEVVGAAWWPGCWPDRSAAPLHRLAGVARRLPDDLTLRGDDARAQRLRDGAGPHPGLRRRGGADRHLATGRRTGRDHPRGVGDPRPRRASPGRRSARVVDGLVGNALRYAHRRVDVQHLTRADDQVRLTVAGDGPGLAADQGEAGFERFARGSQAKPGGSGLGLALVLRAAARPAVTPTPGRHQPAGFGSPPPGRGDHVANVTRWPTRRNVLDAS